MGGPEASREPSGNGKRPHAGIIQPDRRSDHTSCHLRPTFVEGTQPSGKRGRKYGQVYSPLRGRLDPPSAASTNSISNIYSGTSLTSWNTSDRICQRRKRPYALSERCSS